ncbi:DNA ligase (NAD(+)) LigA [Clostridium thermosuccinogenes]|uniref:DNA ligase n=1 Tax=Clostridium thermosuccinogenes TaxID=84032 RepID=A0A2K2FL78_9CLOT|nr:NAD-dependent DNA ligase LigA [Pseudoclostridium thermosuccinogenes]AUS96620.1 DNA ligase (NAD(+)) LigA [Pseudoclostridium thermosuccinogenes]PNT97535.1 DNA ligase (NAD(+)) LigA [Pseudoclostridium thermosuccinogenes]PNT99532.1 DNA ligase (NAD(+)) LigA [Pseudoclostridium thermosuccinogenes]
MDKLQLMKEKIKLLNEASKAYYQENREIMSNLEYDKLYDELLELEKETGIVLSNSPSIHVGYELLGSLPKERHEKPMLSLDKTKDVGALKEWLGDQTGLLSWKLDGLTIVLTYTEGKLLKAVTRGNGEVGEVVTNNVKVFSNIPLNISYKGNLVLRGEAVISYSDFEKINNEIPDVASKYKNPRNLCSGSVRQLNNKVTSERNVHFFAFSIVKADGVDFGNSRMAQLEWLKNQGFDVVTYKKVDSSNIEKAVSWFEENIAKNDFPSDGLVLTYDDIAYGESLGVTAKFPRDSIAFKWRDEIKETKLLEIEWSASRTGLINPVAIFEPVELEGTTVSRASLHNISIMEGLELGIGDTICVYKANMIIPQVSDNLTRSGKVCIPEECPACGSKTIIKQNNDVKSLYCPNEDCPAKQIKLFTLFVSRDAMNIEGLSEATIEKLIGRGLVKEPADLFHIEKFKQEIVSMEGFGEKSYQNLVNAINRSRKTNVVRLLFGLGIPNVGLSNAKNICRKFDYDWERIENATIPQLLEINGVGQIMADNYVRFFSNEKNRRIIKNILNEIEFEPMKSADAERIFENITFVITGSVEHFKNRDELKETIEQKGGKVTGSVTSKTNYLINNDNTSNSTKNKKAKELGIKIITEEEFLNWMNSGVRP